jgi:hypothetical protein
LRVLLSVRTKTQQKQGWNLQESLSANPISHCLIDFRGFVTGGRQGWDFTTQDLEAFLESSSIALKMALKESLASCSLISSTDFTPCLAISRIQESYRFMCRKHTHLSGFPISGLESLLWFKMETLMQNSCCNLLLWVAKICSKELLQRKKVFIPLHESKKSANVHVWSRGTTWMSILSGIQNAGFGA